MNSLFFIALYFTSFTVYGFETDSKKEPVKSPVDSMLEARKKVILDLYKGKFFKDASCEEIANGILTYFELPKLGKSAMISGRGNFDRLRQNESPPVLIDEKTFAHGEIKQIRISMNSDTHSGKPKWILELRRVFDLSKEVKNEIQLESKVLFSMNSRSKQSLCNFEEIKVKVINKGMQKNRDEKYNTDDCLNLFIRKEMARNLTGRKTDKFIKSDCSFALRYSKRAKEYLKHINENH